MREIILARLNEIRTGDEPWVIPPRPPAHAFSPRPSRPIYGGRWEGVMRYIFPNHSVEVGQMDINDLSDSELLVLFEMIIRRLYTQR